MSVEKKIFGSRDGQDIMLYSIKNSKGMQADVTEFGAILVNLFVPDEKGNVTDVVLGYDSLEDYFINSSFLGTTVGPSANRIKDAKFEIEGVTYLLDQNSGQNNLHSHYEKGYHKKVWSAQEGENSVTFSLKDEDGSLGFPGEREFQVTYSLDEENALNISYHARSNKKTVINPTNHTYFNLDGHDSGNIEGHELMLMADYYTPVVEGAIPTGEIAPVEGTPMDFTVSRRIGEGIGADFLQLKLVKGYDHNWVINGQDGTLRHFATAKGPVSGRTMEVYTTLPGVQFYAGNCIDPTQGKGGVSYKERSGFCLETQFFPNSVNQPEFPSCLFGEGKEYDSVTVYKFL